ncbi:MAG: zinc-ribbon domain containing protein [Acidobacteria bacterium]|nr:zinc-ribbon domain containing protein [Acidobacteriota bacterium]MCA1608201.1 zinc-ribbon domain containing protein [Acidobacteriota bacterium]
MSQNVLERTETVTFAESNELAEFEDTNILCIDCSKYFVWTAGEQLFFRDKKLQNPPKRCKDCKQAKNERIAAIAAAQAAGVRQRIEVSINCARCGNSTTVPFYPSQGRPVYCRSCFIEMNPSIIASNGSSSSKTS